MSDETRTVTVEQLAAAIASLAHGRCCWDPDLDSADLFAALPTSTEGLDRLRRQNHEAAVRHDREVASLRSKVAKYENAYRRAAELVRGSPVDWTNDPPSQKPDGWWRYTSQQNRDIIAAAVLAASLSPSPTEENP